MTAPEITLYHAPGACSQVTVCALEMAELPYRLELVNLAKGEQTTPEFLAISPLGKVPYLKVDGVGMGENAGMLSYIDALRPEAAIFSQDRSPWMRGEIVGGLSFCCGTLHPQVRGIFNPQRLTVGEVEGVREMSKTLAKKSFGYAEKRLADRGWWLGERSILDVYVNWAFGVARKGGSDVEAYPLLSSLGDRLQEMPAFRAMQEEEAASLKSFGL